MAASCTTPPKHKKAYAESIGRVLVNNHGKKKYYTVPEVQSAAKTLASVDWVCWAMCLYVSPAEFDEYHKSIGEVCNYSEMKSEMVSAITDNSSSSSFEWLDFDFTSLFD